MKGSDTKAASARAVRTILVLATLPVVASACTTSPYDFPMPTMVGNVQGVAMTGAIATDSEDEVRRRLTKRMNCPAGVDFASLTTERADAKIGTKFLLYKAVMTCTGAAATPGQTTAEIAETPSGDRAIAHAPR